MAKLDKIIEDGKKRTEKVKQLVEFYEEKERKATRYYKIYAWVNQKLTQGVDSYKRSYHNIASKGCVKLAHLWTENILYLSK